MEPKTVLTREQERLMIIGRIIYFVIALGLFISYFRINFVVTKLGIGGPVPVPVSIFCFVMVVLFYGRYLVFPYMEAIREEKLPMTPKEGALKPFADAFQLLKNDIKMAFLFSRWLITGKDYLKK